MAYILNLWPGPVTVWPSSFYFHICFLPAFCGILGCLFNPFKDQKLTTHWSERANSLLTNYPSYTDSLLFGPGKVGQCQFDWICVTWEVCACVHVCVSYQKTSRFADMIPDREWAGSTEHHGRYTELYLERKSPEEGSLRVKTEMLW